MTPAYSFVAAYFAAASAGAAAGALGSGNLPPAEAVK
jgi:hypothetical protein